MIPIKRQSQPTPKSCVATCIAMILDVDVQSVLKFIPEPIGKKELLKFLKEFNIPYKVSEDNELIPGKCYLAVVPSLNLRAGLHQIIIDLRFDYEVIDPNEGRTDKPVFVYGVSGDEENRVVGLYTWAELIEVVPFVGSLPNPKSTNEVVGVVESETEASISAFTKSQNGACRMKNGDFKIVPFFFNSKTPQSYGVYRKSNGEYLNCFSLQREAKAYALKSAKGDLYKNQKELDFK